MCLLQMCVCRCVFCSLRTETGLPTGLLAEFEAKWISISPMSAPFTVTAWWHGTVWRTRPTWRPQLRPPSRWSHSGREREREWGWETKWEVVWGGDGTGSWELKSCFGQLSEFRYTANTPFCVSFCLALHLSVVEFFYKSYLLSYHYWLCQLANEGKH